MPKSLRITTDTDRNLENLQAIIDSLANDLSQYKGKNILIKAQAYEAFARLIRTKDQLQTRSNKCRTVTIDRIASYLIRKGAISRKQLYKSGCYKGGIKVLDEALDVLDELGLLKVSISSHKQDIVYEITQEKIRLEER